VVKLHAFSIDRPLAEPAAVPGGLADEMHVLGGVGFKRSLAHDNGSIAMRGIRISTGRIGAPDRRCIAGVSGIERTFNQI
jgi:hypothetical protein